jgi:ribosomal protein S18 acetylase RimI-like enzyme
VQPHTYVALTSATGEALSEAQLDAVRQTPAGTPEELAQQDAYSTPLTVGPAKVLALFAIVPHAPSAKRAGLAGWLVNRWAATWGWLQRVLWASSMFEYGWSVPVKVLVWMGSLRDAAEKCDRTGLCRPGFADLQVMCVALSLQGQGVGTAVMREAFGVAQELQVAGLKGLCQNDQTRRFYEKCGFRTAEVIAHARDWRGPGTVRQHYLVAWDAEQDSEAPERVKAE